MSELDDLFGTPPAPKPEPVVCPEPGIYYDIPAHVYHSWPAVSSTVLKNYATLPSAARIPWIPNVDANIGSAIHCYSLQGQTGLDAECIFAPAFGKSKDDIAARNLLQKENPDKVLLPPYYGSPAPGEPIMDILRGVDDSLQSHPKLGPVLRDSAKEVSLVWVDLDSGCLCKARLDIWDGSVIWDLKKTRSIKSFGWQMKDLRYDVQDGHYINGAIACGLPAVGFAFVPIETGWPYQVAWGYRDLEKLEQDKYEARRLIGLVKQSQLTGYWPNFPIPSHVFDLNDIQPDDTALLF